jgi:osmoprotectant transport system permease protein
MSWALSNASYLAHLTGQNAYLALVPVLVGLAVSLPLGVACVRYGWLYPPVLGLTSILYALPALALFVVLIAYTGLTDTTVMIPLGIYSLAAIFPSVVDGLRSVPAPVRQAAIAMGFGTWRRLIRVELPVAVPVIIAGLRVATVSSISLVSVGALIGTGGLGDLFTDGENRSFPTEIIVGIVLIIVLTIVADGILVFLRRLLTPWQRGTGRATSLGSLRASLRGQTGGAGTGALT